MNQVSIIGATISGNRGAEAMLSTVMGRILEENPDARFNVYSYYPKEDQSLCGHKNIRIFSATPACLVFVLFPFALLLGALKFVRLGFLRPFFPKSVRALEDSDVLIDISGVSFMDGRAIFIPFNILTIFPAMLVGTPVVKFSQALGPFNSPVVKLPAKVFLSRCTKIFARGEKTRQNLQDLELGEDIIDNAADLAFLHKQAYCLSNENPQYLNAVIGKIEKLKKKGKPLIGLCPSSVIASRARKEKWNYPELLANIVKKLAAKGFSVLLFPNATREKSKKLRNNDLPVIEKTARYLAAFNEYPDDVIIITKDINTGGIKTLMEYCDLNIVSRFHAMIASLTLAKPLIVMGWGHKYQEVMEQFGLGAYVFDYKNNTPSLLVDKVVLVMKNKQNLQEKIRAALPEARKRSNHQFAFLFDMFGR